MNIRAICVGWVATMATMATLLGSARAQEPMHTMPPMADTAIFVHGIFDRLEAQTGAGGPALRWSGEAWAGNDRDKIWLKSEGVARDRRRLDDGRHELLYDRAISAYADLQAGVRVDWDSGPGRTWAALGVQGLSPFFFDYEATAYLADRGRAAARFGVSYDMPITQRIVLQPQASANFYGEADRARGIGAGLSDLEAGLRLRYEISRKFAPYVGVAYAGKFGETARMARRAGDPADSVQCVFGIRGWF